MNLSLCCRNATPTGAKCGYPGLRGRPGAVSLAPFQHLSCTEHHGKQCPDDGIRGHGRDSGAPDWRTSLHVGQERLSGQRASSAPPHPRRWVAVPGREVPAPTPPSVPSLPPASLVRGQAHSQPFNLSVLHPDTGARDYTHSTDE